MGFSKRCTQSQLLSNLSSLICGYPPSVSWVLTHRFVTGTYSGIFFSVIICKPLHSLYFVFTYSTWHFYFNICSFHYILRLLFRSVCSSINNFLWFSLLLYYTLNFSRLISPACFLNLNVSPPCACNDCTLRVSVPCCLLLWFVGVTAGEEL